MTVTFVTSTADATSFPREAKSVPAARRWTRTTLAALDTDTVECAEVLNTELATNAIKHGGGDAFTVSTSVQGRVLRVEVYDAGSDSKPNLDHAPAPGSLSEGGWGLQLLVYYGALWGYTKTPDGGCLVWYELPLSTEADPASARDAPDRSLEKDPQEV